MIKYWKRNLGRQHHRGDPKKESTQKHGVSGKEQENIIRITSINQSQEGPGVVAHACNSSY
jgi:hypothetical protein